MIINSLVAENLLKYRRLSLDEVPERGVIAISGQNESGKSSIGESVCFALFGRTFAVGEDELEKLIRWGESRCTVTLGFSAGDGARYSVTRTLDRDGNHSARLCRAEDPENPIARGVEAVAAALVDILGYEYDEYIESFYLAQREITTPHPHSYAVKIMAGIAPLEQARAELEDEVEQERAAIATAEEKIADLEERISVLGFDPEVLSGSEGGLVDARKQEQEIRKQREDLVAAAADYREREPQLRAAEDSRGSAGFLRALFFLVAALVLGVWALLTQAGDSSLGKQVGDFLTTNLGGGQPFDAMLLLYGGGATAVLFVLFWIRAAVLDGRIQTLRDAGDGLRLELERLDDMETQLETPARETDEEGGEPPVVRADPELRAHLQRRISQGAAGANEVREAVERDTAWLDQGLGRVQQRIADLERQIQREKERRDEHIKLSAMSEGFADQAQEHRHRIRVREHADELLNGAIRQLSHRFNHVLRGLVGKTLPMFTEGRYEHLQIDENLTVRAFSNDKRDFMDLDEISSGTQRQIMLALRLALSQQLIHRVVNGRQFLFLDEPFAFFDERRTRSALEVLPGLSDEVHQIWIVAQQFPDDILFDVRVLCDRALDQLRAA